MSSPSSGGEHDSTGLRAAVSLNTPLLRCASSRNTRAVRRRFRDDTANFANGEPMVSRFAFCEAEMMICHRVVRYHSYYGLGGAVADVSPFPINLLAELPSMAAAQTVGVLGTGKNFSTRRFETEVNQCSVDWGPRLNLVVRSERIVSLCPAIICACQTRPTDKAHIMITQRTIIQVFCDSDIGRRRSGMSGGSPSTGGRPKGTAAKTNARNSRAKTYRNLSL